jgi:conjugative transfer signal peptidase TraF
MNVRVFRIEVPLWAALVFQPVLVLLLIVWIGWAVCRYGDFRIAYSPSVPVGLYRLDEHRTPQRGDYVMFCPPAGPVFEAALQHFWIAPGDCPSGTRHLMKLVVGIEGDHVSFRKDGVVIDGRRVPDSSCRTKDARGVLLPRPAVRDVVLGHDERVLMSLKGPDSFDARYFGPITGQITGRLEPILTWDM